MLSLSERCHLFSGKSMFLLNLGHCRCVFIRCPPLRDILYEGFLIICAHVWMYMLLHVLITYVHVYLTIANGSWEFISALAHIHVYIQYIHVYTYLQMYLLGSEVCCCCETSRLCQGLVSSFVAASAFCDLVPRLFLVILLYMYIKECEVYRDWAGLK